MLKEEKERREQYLELNRRLEIHDMLVEKYLDEMETFPGFCKGLAEIERKFKMMIEQNDIITVSNDDLDETNILSDLLDQKFFIEQVMSHSFQLENRNRMNTGSSSGSDMNVLSTITNEVPNYNPYNANSAGGQTLSKRRGRGGGNTFHLETTGLPVPNQPYVDPSESALNPFPRNFTSSA
jgi:hypothetical protein